MRIGSIDRAGVRTRPCPLCGGPAVATARYPTAVCDDCRGKTVCRDGRTVTGYNTSMSGGFEAVHVDDRSVCEQVSAEGVVWIDGRECRIGEARFGGVVVDVAPEPGSG